MKLGVLLEPDDENRVAIVPGSVKKLMKKGLEIFVESGAGNKSNYPDSEYLNAGATICTRDEALSCEIVMSIRMLDSNQLRNGMNLVCVADLQGVATSQLLSLHKLEFEKSVVSN